MTPISILIISHQKPRFVKQAVYSVLGQTLEDWNGIVVDSGGLYVALLDAFGSGNDHIRVAMSDETPGLAERINPSSWIINRWLRGEWGQLGELIMFLCDDDLLYPWAFQVFWDAHRKQGWQAMYGSQHVAHSDAAGNTEILGERRADMPRGVLAQGPGLDCQVDYLQFCFAKSLLTPYRAKYGDEIIPEDLEHKLHADGIFMQRMSEFSIVHPVPYFVGMNRRTPESVFCGSRLQPPGALSNTMASSS